MCVSETTLCSSASRKVSPSDITFFAMAECPSSPPSRDDLPEGGVNGDGKVARTQEENSTHVYFYVSSAGKVNPELTEKFPLFPTDLVISEKLTYLVPRVCIFFLNTQTHNTQTPTHPDPYYLSSSRDNHNNITPSLCYTLYLLPLVNFRFSYHPHFIRDVVFNI